MPLPAVGHCVDKLLRSFNQETGFYDRGGPKASVRGDYRETRLVVRPWFVDQPLDVEPRSVSHMSSDLQDAEQR